MHYGSYTETDAVTAAEWLRLALALAWVDGARWA